MPTLIRIQHAAVLEPPAQQALQELARFVAQQTGRRVEPVPALASPHILVIGDMPRVPAAEIRHDGYALMPGAGGLALIAHSAKGLLNAVYGYLAWAGVRWPGPGEEVLPPGALRVPEAPIVRSPAFPRRGVYHWYNGGGWEMWCEWYARLGFNDIIPLSTPEEWPETQQVAERFGIDLQIGNHGLPDMLPRDLKEEHPDYFRALQPPDFDRRRFPDYNHCTGSPEAQRLIGNNARRWARQYPGARVYHLWADDLPAGGWCYCARCMGYPAQDQALRASNALAEGICGDNPAAHVAHILYHDTIEPPRLVTPHPGLLPLYAPRERCYGHALNDPHCARNRYFAERLEQALDYFGRPAWILYEYYSDYVLFRGMMPVLPEVIAGDLRYYHAQGLDCAQHLYIGERIGLLLNIHIFAQQTWDLDADPWEPLRRLADGVPGLLEAWQLQAQAAARWTAICQWPLDRYSDYRFLLELPQEEAEAYRTALRQAAEELTRALELLPAKLPAWAERERLSLQTSALIVRQMEAQQTMLQELHRCVNGEDRRQDALAAYRQTVRHGQAASRLFTKQGMHAGNMCSTAYFQCYLPMIEEIWREKISTVQRTPRAAKTAALAEFGKVGTDHYSG